MVASFDQSVRETLLDARARLLEVRQGIIANGEPTLDPDGILLPTSERDRALTLMIDQHLEEIDEALARLEHGRYGVCARCGQPIAPRRLQALPAAALCVRCQGAADRQPGRGGWGASPR